MFFDIYLNTDNSINPDFPHDAQWVLPDLQIQSGWGEVDLYQCQFINAFPSIRTGINDQLKIDFWTNGGGNHASITYTIPQGQYTLTQMVTELNVLFAATTPTGWGGAGHGLVASTSSINTTYTLTLSVLLADQDGRGFSILPSNATTSLGLYALQYTGDVYPVQVNSVTGNMVNLAGPNAIQILSPSFNTNNYSSDKQTSIFAKLNLDVSYGEMFDFLNTQWKGLRINLSDMRYIHIRIVDSDGNPLIFPPYSGITYTLRVKYSID